MRDRFTAFERYIKALSPGDKLIAYTLFVLVAIAAVLAAYALESRFLVSVPAQGGSLVEGEVGSPRFANPLLAITDADRDLTALTYAGLMGVSGDGSLVPVLASGYTVSPDGKTYVFTLKADAQFSDGTPVTADDVVFTVGKAQDAGVKSPEYADWAGITATAVDSHTVQFILSKPYAPFLGNTTLGILPERLWQGISDEEFAFTNLAAEPVGAGPFKVSSVSRDSSGLITSYTVVANPRYVLGRPYLDSITLRFYAQQQDLVKALTAGSVDSAYGFPAANSYSATLRSPYSRVFGVFFNGANNAALARVEVRKALSLAIDREGIVNQVLGGYATAIMGPVPPGSGVDEVEAPVSTDPAADASAVLSAAGWKYDASGRAWTYGSGKSALSLSSITIKTSDVPELKGVAGAVKADWERLGIATDVELYEPGDLSQNVIRPRKYDALLFGEVIGRDLDLYPFWHSSQRTDPGLNIVGYADKDVDALLADARQTSDPAVRASDLAKIEAAVAAAYPAAFVESPNFIYAVPKDLRGVSLPQITTPADRFASVANWYLHTEDVWPFLAKTSRSIN